MDVDVSVTIRRADVTRLFAALGIDPRHVTSVHVDLLPNDLVHIRVVRVATQAELDALASELEARPLQPKED